MPLPLRALILIALIIGVPLFVGYQLVAVFPAGRPYAWYFGGLCSFAFTVATIITASRLPQLYVKFYEAKKVTGSQYQNQLRTFGLSAQKAGIGIPELYMISDAAPHAMAVGWLPSTRTILVTRGLFDSLEPDQFQAYLDYLITMIAKGELGIMSLGCAAAYVALLPLKLADMADSDALRVILTVIFGWFGAIYLHAIGVGSHAYEIDQAAGSFHGVGGHLALASALNEGTKTLFKHPINRLDYSSSPLFVVNPLGATGVAGIFATHAPTPKRVKRLQRKGTRAVGKEAVAKSKGLV
ncbi:MAG TPA: hypothetical protein VEI97_03625 [bacterium]|nr:hypothetical protein [bacterium]